MEAPVEIRYAGVVVGRAQDVQSTADGDSPSLFLVVREPMPVGSVVRLRTGDRETPARVVHTVESSNPDACGMQVRLIGEAEEVATEWIPPPAVAEKARPADEPVQTAMPVIEVGMPTGEPASSPSPGEPSGQSPTALVDSSPAPASPAEVGADAPSGAPAVEMQEPAPEPAIAVLAAEPSAAAPAASGEIAAIPEAVPVAVGSSMTGALENAAEGSPGSDDVGQAEDAASSDTGAGEQSASEDLPPARPITGPSGRRKTKRRR